MHEREIFLLLFSKASKDKFSCELPWSMYIKDPSHSSPPIDEEFEVT
jgi:hypothetical protein